MTFSGARFHPTPPPIAPAQGRQGSYVYYDERIVLAVNVALVTRRPLLVTGLPGSGKSTLAADVACQLGWTFVPSVITSRTRLEDLVGSVDLVRRLGDAQVGKLLPGDKQYLIPGVLWWAVHPGSAQNLPSAGGRDPRQWPENARHGAVVLLDEIDKAEPDLPNDLLGPLDNLQLDIPRLGVRSPSTDVLVVITSNGERDMPPAFLRRCVSLELRDQNSAFLTAVAESHFGPAVDGDDLYLAVALKTLELQERAQAEGRRVPSTAEYLDTIRACLAFGERPNSKNWLAIEEAALSKGSPSFDVTDD